VIRTKTTSASLDAALLWNKNAPADMAEARAIVWLNANGVIYEQNIGFVMDYATRLNCHAVVFNYRGVGESKGWPYISADLGDDGAAMVEYVMKTLGVAEKNVIIHGHSIGGGVMSMLVGKFKSALVVNDRSFWSLGAEAAMLMDITGLCKFMGGLFGSYFLIVGWFVKVALSSESAVDLSWYPGFSMSMMVGAAVGWMGLGKSGAIVAITPKILTYMGWIMESGLRFVFFCVVNFRSRMHRIVLLGAKPAYMCSNNTPLGCPPAYLLSL
jgi:pimeloyl-ACP methyl ester carboxylesterase